MGDSLTCADISCAGYLYYDEPPSPSIAPPTPRSTAELARIAATPGWKHPYDLMQRAFPSSIMTKKERD